MKIGRVSLAVDIDNKVYFVCLSNEKLKLLVKFAESLSENGKLPVKKAPEDYKFHELEV